MPERVRYIEIQNKTTIFGWAGSSDDSEFAELTAENEKVKIEIIPEAATIVLSTSKSMVHKPISPRLASFFNRSLPHDNEVLRIQTEVLSLDFPEPFTDIICSMAESIKNI